MLEIFVPIEIHNYGKINTISDTFLDIVRESFPKIKIEKFDSKLFKWLHIISADFNERLIILCNGAFWDTYFVDFDYIEHNFEFLGIKIVWENKVTDNIQNITSNFTQIVADLQSKKLLTNSKKEIIKNKIDSSFFALSGVVFLLYNLLWKINTNLTELDSISAEVHYGWPAEVLAETSLTKKIEIESEIKKTEIQLELFIDAIKLLIK